jgi:hypothetical protein
MSLLSSIGSLGIMIQIDTFSLLQQFAKTPSSLVGLLSNDQQAAMVLVKIACNKVWKVLMEHCLYFADRLFDCKE